MRTSFALGTVALVTLAACTKDASRAPGEPRAATVERATVDGETRERASTCEPCGFFSFRCGVKTENPSKKCCPTWVANDEIDARTCARTQPELRRVCWGYADDGTCVDPDGCGCIDYP